MVSDLFDTNRICCPSSHIDCTAELCCVDVTRSVARIGCCLIVPGLHAWYDMNQEKLTLANTWSHPISPSVTWKFVVPVVFAWLLLLFKLGIQNYNRTLLCDINTCVPLTDGLWDRSVTPDLYFATCCYSQHVPTTTELHGLEDSLLHVFLFYFRFCFNSSLHLIFSVCSVSKMLRILSFVDVHLECANAGSCTIYVRNFVPYLFRVCSCNPVIKKSPVQWHDYG